MLTSVARFQYPVDLWEKEICEAELKLLQLQFHLEFYLVRQFDRCQKNFIQNKTQYSQRNFN